MLTGCGATFKTKLGLKRHMDRHCGVYQYYCPYCKKGISGTTDTKYHIKKYHTGLLGFHCANCMQDLQTIHKLKKHLEQENLCNQGSGPKKTKAKK